jgi:hypothetical protein
MLSTTLSDAVLAPMDVGWLTTDTTIDWPAPRSLGIALPFVRMN